MARQVDSHRLETGATGSAEAGMESADCVMDPVRTRIANSPSLTTHRQRPIARHSIIRYTAAMPTESDAVYYAPKDYASIPRRITSFLLDIFVVVLLIAVASSAVQVSLVPSAVNAMPRSPEKQKLINKYLKPVKVPMVLGWFVLVVAYHIVLRTTRGGTLGYRLTRIRLVDMAGHVPVLKALLRRFLLAVPGCLMFGATYLNCLRNPARRAGHDQWSGTWLVRTRAEPAGPARPVYQTRLFGTFLLTFADIEPATDEEDASEPEKDGGIKSNEQDAIL